ncbi:MAG TPA: TonB-dependent receptor [Terriglobales bacterium]|nr:TonB-dependent receptor [Terriglobales bacterium]
MRFRSFYTCLFVIVAASLMFGQAGGNSSILGTVTDNSGAVVANAVVNVTNLNTGQVAHTTTGTSGDFTVPSLNPGSYSVAVEAPGFQKSVTNDIALSVDQKARVNVALKAGAVSTTVEVNATAVSLDTDTSALSQLVSQKQVESLPLNGRNFLQLLLIGAGAVTVGGEQGTMRQGQGNAISINGGRPEGNNYTLDGLINTDTALVTPAVILSQDAIQEFKVESGTYSAEYGYSASQINIVSKGGTNQLHGTLFEFNRNDAFDAKPFPTFTDVNAGTPTALPELRQNQFGFVVTGPVYIPKVYDGRNKTFFMANYEGWRIINGARVNYTFPNPAVLQGDFSGETYPAGVGGLPGGALPAYGTSDCTTLLGLGYNCMPVDPMTGQPFPGNIVPADRFTSRIGLVAVANNFWPTPTIPNQPEGVVNFIKNYGFPLKTNQQTYRGDQSLGKLGSVFFRYTRSHYQNSGPYNSNDLVHGTEFYFQDQRNYAASHTINLGSKNVNNFRFSYLSANAPQGGSEIPNDQVQALGLTGVFTKFSPLQQTWPSVGLTGSGGVGGSGNSYSGSEQPAWEFADSFTSIHGKHTLGMGFDIRRVKLTRNLDDDFYGDWGFSSSLVQNNSAINPKTGVSSCPNAPVSVNGGTPAPLCGTGNAVADMMLGYYSSAGGFVPGPLSPTDTAGNPQTHVFNYYAPYFQDDWKVTQKLTLNLGLRWDYRAAAYEAQNHFFWLDTTNPRGGLCYADKTLSTNGVAPGGDDTSGPILRYCGSVPHEGSKKPFAPRFGFAYRLTDKTVVRGGYGIFYDSAEGREIDDSGDIYPYSIRNSLAPGTDPTLNKFTNNQFTPYDTLSPFPASTLSFLAVIESENPINPYVQSYNLSIERELARNTTLEVNYIGTHSLHLLDRRNIAQPNPIPDASLAFCQAQDANGYINLDKSPCKVSDRRPYPNFTNFYIDSDWHGYAKYNAMNVKFEHRTGDLAVTGVFTWAKSMDDKSAAAGVGATGEGFQGTSDNHHPELDYGPSDFNVDHRFVASYVYQLPIGRGKKLLGGSSRALNMLVGGWEMTGITTFQTGFPISVYANDLGGVLQAVPQRASIVAGCDIHGGSTGQFQRLNPACFTQPLLGVFGDTARNFLRQPGINNWDMGFGKSFAFTERVRFGLHVDTFNTFNHHQYSGDVGGLVVAGSGGNTAISRSLGASDFGQITQAGSARVLQLSGKLIF